MQLFLVDWVMAIYGHVGVGIDQAGHPLVFDIRVLKETAKKLQHESAQCAME